MAAPRIVTPLALVLAATFGSLGALGAGSLAGCSDSASSSSSSSSGSSGGSSGTSGSSGGASDGAVPEDGATTRDGGSDASRADASGTGETCVGFAKSMPCGVGGLPDYGYVCFEGSPPGIAGCQLASSTGSFGDTYCCTENACVAQPDQDKQCTAAGTPHRFQCPPGENGQPLPAPAGCVASGGGGSAVENFYCCP